VAVTDIDLCVFPKAYLKTAPHRPTGEKSASKRNETVKQNNVKPYNVHLSSVK
jgi:hypothetical protein